MKHLYGSLKPSGNTRGKIQYYTTECHTNPLVYVGPWIHFIAILTYRYKLTYVETTSIIRAAGTKSYSPYFFCLAAEGYLFRGVPQQQRGILIGFHIFKLMDKLEQERTGAIPGLHYQVNRDNQITEEEWVEHVQELVWAQLESYSDGLDGNAKKRQRMYKQLLEKVVKRWKMVDRLAGNHVLLACAALGTIPLCYSSEYAQAQKSPSISDIAKRYSFRCREKEAGQFLDSLTTIMCKNGYPSNRRIAEQVACKVSRNKKETESTYKDIYFEQMNVYEMVNGNLRIYFPPSRNRPSVDLDSGLIKYWQYNWKWLDLKHLSTFAKMEKLPEAFEKQPKDRAPAQNQKHLCFYRRR